MEPLGVLLQEHGVIAGVVPDHVQHKPHAPGLQAYLERLEIIQGSKTRLYPPLPCRPIPVVGPPVSKSFLSTVTHGREPDSPHPHGFNPVEVL